MQVQESLAQLTTSAAAAGSSGEGAAAPDSCRSLLANQSRGVCAGLLPARPSAGCALGEPCGQRDGAHAGAQAGWAWGEAGGRQQQAAPALQLGTCKEMATEPPTWLSCSSPDSLPSSPASRRRKPPGRGRGGAEAGASCSGLLSPQPAAAARRCRRDSGFFTVLCALSRSAVFSASAASAHCCGRRAAAFFFLPIDAAGRKTGGGAAVALAAGPLAIAAIARGPAPRRVLCEPGSLRWGRPSTAAAPTEARGGRRSLCQTLLRAAKFELLVRSQSAAARKSASELAPPCMATCGSLTLALLAQLPLRHHQQLWRCRGSALRRTLAEPSRAPAACRATAWRQLAVCSVPHAPPIRPPLLPAPPPTARCRRRLRWTPPPMRAWRRWARWGRCGGTVPTTATCRSSQSWTRAARAAAAQWHAPQQAPRHGGGQPCPQPTPQQLPPLCSPALS